MAISGISSRKPLRLMSEFVSRVWLGLLRTASFASSSAACDSFQAVYVRKSAMVWAAEVGCLPARKVGGPDGGLLLGPLCSPWFLVFPGESLWLFLSFSFSIMVSPVLAGRSCLFPERMLRVTVCFLLSELGG